MYSSAVDLYITPAGDVSESSEKGELFLVAGAALSDADALRLKLRPRRLSETQLVAELGLPVYRSLMEAGLHNVPLINAADDDTLLNLAHIGPATVEKIRAIIMAEYSAE